MNSNSCSLGFNHKQLLIEASRVTELVGSVAVIHQNFLEEFLLFD